MTKVKHGVNCTCCGVVPMVIDLKKLKEMPAPRDCAAVYIATVSPSDMY